MSSPSGSVCLKTLDHFDDVEKDHCPCRKCRLQMLYDHGKRMRQYRNAQATKQTTDEHSFAPRINPRSAKMSPAGDDRLHELYTKGVARLKQSTHNQNLERHPDHSFHPEINASSVAMLQEKNALQFSTRLDTHHAKRRVARVHAARQRNEKEMQDCTFTPAVNQRSARLMTDTDTDVLTRLSNFKARKEEKQRIIREQREEEKKRAEVAECTFRPQITKHSPSKASKARQVQKVAGFGTFMKRKDQRKKQVEEQQSREQAAFPSGRGYTGRVTKPKPFNLSTQVRMQDKLRKQYPTAYGSVRRKGGSPGSSKGRRSRNISADPAMSAPQLEEEEEAAEAGVGVTLSPQHTASQSQEFQLTEPETFQIKSPVVEQHGPLVRSQTDSNLVRAHASVHSVAAHEAKHDSPRVQVPSPRLVQQQQQQQQKKKKTQRPVLSTSPTKVADIPPVSIPSDTKMKSAWGDVGSSAAAGAPASSPVSSIAKTERSVQSQPVTPARGLSDMPRKDPPRHAASAGNLGRKKKPRSKGVKKVWKGLKKRLSKVFTPEKYKQKMAAREAQRQAEEAELSASMEAKERTREEERKRLEQLQLEEEQERRRMQQEQEEEEQQQQQQQTQAAPQLSKEQLESLRVLDSLLRQQGPAASAGASGVPSTPPQRQQQPPVDLSGLSPQQLQTLVQLAAMSGVSPSSGAQGAQPQDQGRSHSALSSASLQQQEKQQSVAGPSGYPAVRTMSEDSGFGPSEMPPHTPEMPDVTEEVVDFSSDELSVASEQKQARESKVNSLESPPLMGGTGGSLASSGDSGPLGTTYVTTEPHPAQADLHIAELQRAVQLRGGSGQQ